MTLAGLTASTQWRNDDSPPSSAWTFSPSCLIVVHASTFFACVGGSLTHTNVGLCVRVRVCGMAVEEREYFEMVKDVRREEIKASQVSVGC
jgi:hypothetical protein